MLLAIISAISCLVITPCCWKNVLRTMSRPYWNTGNSRDFAIAMIAAFNFTIRCARCVPSSDISCRTKPSGSYWSMIVAIFLRHRSCFRAPRISGVPQSNGARGLSNSTNAKPRVLRCTESANRYRRVWFIQHLVAHDLNGLTLLQENPTWFVFPSKDCLEAFRIAHWLWISASVAPRLVGAETGPRPERQTTRSTRESQGDLARA
jgi:hypothetical protein